MREPFEGKISYWCGPGLSFESTAYLDSRDADTGYVYGTNKYDDRPIMVWWNRATRRWEEVTHGNGQ